jgi:hypothetical protein
MQTVDEDRALKQNSTIRRNRAWSAGLPALAIVPLLLAGCGSSASDTVTPAAPATTAAASTQLTVTVDEGAGKTEDWTLSCDPAGGTHPKPAEACAALAAKGKTALPPVSTGVMCTQIYGGPQTAKIVGTWDGKPVNATFSRQNGCQVNRWKALEGLLPVTAGAGVG